MFLRYNVQDGFQAVSPTKYEIFRILRLKAAMNSQIGFEMKNNTNNRRRGEQADQGREGTGGSLRVGCLPDRRRR